MTALVVLGSFTAGLLTGIGLVIRATRNIEPKAWDEGYLCGAEAHRERLL